MYASEVHCAPTAEIHPNLLNMGFYSSLWKKKYF